MHHFKQSHSSVHIKEGCVYIYVNYDSYWMCQMISLNKQDLFQFPIALQKSSKYQLVYYDVLINAFYVYIIIKMAGPLVLSVNNRYKGSIRANIRYI